MDECMHTLASYVVFSADLNAWDSQKKWLQMPGFKKSKLWEKY